jgi:hypothetical protein
MLQEDDEIALASVTDKGKGKEREEFDLDHNHRSFSDQLEGPMYPPINEDAEETRRVEEVVSDRMLSRVCLIFCRLESQKVGSSRASAKKGCPRIAVSYCSVPHFRRFAARQPVILRSQGQATFYQQSRGPCCSAIA